MKIRQIKIHNFRGIKKLDFSLPDKSVFCLIGRGDSTKSSILEAIRFAFYPHWNIDIDDSDFYMGKTSEDIIIEITVGELPEEFLQTSKYGYLLRGWNKEKLLLKDEPEDELEEALTIQFRVDSSLEPKWRVVNDRNSEGEELKTADRSKLSVGYIGEFSDRHLRWSRGSVLNRITDVQSKNNPLVEVARAAKTSLNSNRDKHLADFDAAAKKAEDAAKKLGVPVLDIYRAHLDLAAVNISLGGLALHDGDIPLRQLGLGSRRMLTCAMQKETLAQPHITLFDEVEMALEPLRISRLIKEIKSDKTGQYFLTTHSPVVLKELTVAELYVVQSNEGKTDIFSANQFGGNIQGNIRSEAEAFLSKKVIVCEGATEVGLCRGLDNWWVLQGKTTFAYEGVTWLDAGTANKVREYATNLDILGYEVAVIVDSDSKQNFSQRDADYLRNKGIEVIQWEDGLSTEERIIMDLPWTGVLSSIEFVAENKTKDKNVLIDQIQTQYSGSDFNRDPSKWKDCKEMRSAIAKAAKASCWFKRQDYAEEWFGTVVQNSLEKMAGKKSLEKFLILRNWIERERTGTKS